MSGLFKWLSKKFKDDKTKACDSWVTVNVETERKKDNAAIKTVDFGTSVDSKRFGDSQCSSSTLLNDKTTKDKQYDKDLSKPKTRSTHAVHSSSYRDTTNLSVRPKLTTNPDTDICLNVDTVSTKEKQFCDKTQKHVDTYFPVTNSKYKLPSSSNDNKIATSDTSSRTLTDLNPIVISKKADETFRPNTRASWDTPTIQRNTTTIHGTKIRSTSVSNIYYGDEKALTDIRIQKNEVKRTNESNLKEQDNTSFNSWTKVCDFLQTDNDQGDTLASGDVEVMSANQKMHQTETTKETRYKLSQKNQKHDQSLQAGQIVNKREVGFLEQNSNDLVKIRERNFPVQSDSDNSIMSGHSEVSSTKQTMTQRDTIIQQTEKRLPPKLHHHDEILGGGNISIKGTIDSTQPIIKDAKKIMERNSSLENDSYKNISLHTIDTKTLKSIKTESMNQTYDPFQSNISHGKCIVNVNQDAAKTRSTVMAYPVSFEKVVKQEWEHRKRLYEDTYRKELKNLDHNEIKIVSKADSISVSSSDESAKLEPLPFVNKKVDACVVKDKEQPPTTKDYHKDIRVIPEVTKSGDKPDSILLEPSNIETVGGCFEKFTLFTNNANNNSKRQQDIASNLSKLSIKCEVTKNSYPNEDQMKMDKAQRDAPKTSYSSNHTSSDTPKLDTDYDSHLGAGINKEKKVMQELSIEASVTDIIDQNTANKYEALNDEERNSAPVTHDSVQIICDNPSAVCSQLELRNKPAIQEFTGESKVKSRKEMPGNKPLLKSDSSSSLNKTDDSPVPQTFLLKIYERANITNFEAFLQQRIGSQIKFKIEDIVLRPTRVDIVVEFPSKSAGRKATHILQTNSKIWCSLYKGKKTDTNNAISDINSKSKSTKTTKDGLKVNEEHKMQRSQEKRSLPQNKGKCNSRNELQEEIARDISNSKSHSVIISKDQQKVKAKYKTQANESKGIKISGKECSNKTTGLSESMERLQILEDVAIASIPPTFAKNDLQNSEHLDTVDKGLELKAPRTYETEITTNISKSIENKAENIKTSTKSVKVGTGNQTHATSVKQESILPTKKDEKRDLNSKEEEIISKPVKMKTRDTKSNTQSHILPPDQIEITENKHNIQKSEEGNTKTETNNEIVIPRLEDLAFKAALKARTQNPATKKETRSGNAALQKTRDAKSKDGAIKADRNDKTTVSKKEISNTENACRALPITDNTRREQTEECSDKPGDEKTDIKTLRTEDTQCELAQLQQKTNTSSKPQVLEIEIVNLERKESNIEKFLLQRLSKAIKFKINEVTTIDNAKFLSVEFSSTNSSKQAIQLLHKSNAKSRTKVWCSVNQERKEKLKEQRLSKFVSELADVARDLILNHHTNITEISTYLEAISSKKAKFQAIAEYQREKKEKEALTSKMNEMEKQKAEFKSFLGSLYDKLETLKHSVYDDIDLTQLETAFKIECDRFSHRLPIYACRTDIVKVIDENQASVVLGETGSGKSTQIVQYLYQTGRFSQGTIVCTQPRKVAAISLATHVAKEMASNVGHLVGYQVGLHTKKCKETKILYMTDHVLLNECLKDRLLTSFSCIVIDEAHERSIFTDLLLGMIKQCLPLRPDLRVVITSATIEPHIFVNFFENNCPVLAVSGRTFPVDIEWSEEDCDDNYEQKTLQKAIQVHKTEGKGDILAFLTSPIEVEKCCQKFEERLGGRNDFVCLPLHGKLQANEQQQVFIPPPRGKRKIVFATNSAETSITIPGIKYVIDSGRIKEMQFDPKKNISSLVVTLVTKSSANQRSGRAGRVAPGKCFRLYSQKDYEGMHACSTPEILRINLGQALLKLIELSVDPLSFDFVESPPKDQMEKAMDMLESIGAVLAGKITDVGRWIAKLPFQPIFGVFVHDALKYNTGLEALVLTACCGSGGSLFYRSGTAKEKMDADKMKIRFSHQGGDIMTMLNAFREWHQQPERDKGKWCKQNFVNGKTIKAVRETVTEVISILRKELQVKLEFRFNKSTEVDVLLQKMLFKTFKHNVCCFLGHEKAGYHIIHKAHNVCLFPSSALPSLGLQPEWIVIEQVLNINRDYGVNATPVPVEWIDEGIQEGWLKEFQKERAEQQKVSLVLQIGLGDRCFRDFVGPRYTRVKELESDLQTLCGQNIVIVDTDSKLGKVNIYASNWLQSILTYGMDNTVVPIQAKYKSEKSEQYLSSSKEGTRVVMSAGCDIVDILMPDEYKTVLVVSTSFVTSYLTVEDVRLEFQRYGEIENIEMFRYTKNGQKTWGKVTYATMKQAENAVEQSKEEEMFARPTGNLRNQNEHRFRAKLEWCRRPSKGIGFVQFSGRTLADSILRNYRSMVIGGTIANLSVSKNNNDQIFVGRLNKFVNEEVLKNSFLDKFQLSDREIVRASIVRERVDTSRLELDSIRRRLDAHLAVCVKDGKCSLNMKPTKPTDYTFLAFTSFSKVEEGQDACRHLVANFRPNGEIISTSVTLQASLLVIRAVHEKCSDKIKETIAKLNKQDGIDIRHRLLRNGNCVIDINCDHVETLHRCRSKLGKITQGLKMTKDDFPNIHELFTRSGRYELKKIAAQTNALIIDDYRILEIAIFGDHKQQQMTLAILQKYLHDLTLGITKSLTLKGPDKPYGVIKQIFLQYGIDLEKLKRGIKGLHCLQVDLRNHSISINGSEDAVDRAITEINDVIERLRQTQNCNQVENEEDQCPICFMEIEDGEMYRLESCGHPFCKTCIVPQLESAVGSSDFPISCCKEGCDEMWSWQDLMSLSLKSGMSINSLVNRAANTYVAKHDKQYKYCISPDCPSIYRVTRRSGIFCCCECEARICTACHIQYHDGMTCDMMKELKDDSTGIKIWMQKDPHNRKPCPNCGLPIQKNGGCNNMLCAKCKRNICWLCLEHFDNEQQCYAHLSKKHGGFGGGY